MNVYYRLDVTYPWAPRGRQLDAPIGAVVGQQAEASGCGFGERDLSFYFDVRREAIAARQRVKATTFTLPVTTTLSAFRKD